MPLEILRRDPEKTYWAAEERSEDVVHAVRDRIENYGEVMRNSRILKRIIRNYRYYHGLFFPGAIDTGDSEIKHLGDSGELAGLAINDFRSLVEQIAALVTRNFPKYDVRAINSDLAALHQSRIGKSIMEAYRRDKKLDFFLRTAFLHALIFNVGYVYTYWDAESGEDYDADGADIIKTGDVGFKNPTIFDLAYDPASRDPSEWQWVAIRCLENKWDLAARYPWQEDDILKMDRQNDESAMFYFRVSDETMTDKIDVWHFYHLPSDALPDGRYMAFVGDRVLGEEEGEDRSGIDLPMPYRELPVDRCAAGELLLTCFGYSPAMDMQGPQEALNAESSTIASNHRATGVNNWWVEEGDSVNYQQLMGNLNIVHSRTQPQPMQGPQTAREIFEYRNQMRVDMELISGINSVRRGTPEGGLRSASGAAFALLDAKANESNAGPIWSYKRMVEGVGTKLLRLLNQFPDSQRVLTVTGKANRSKQIFIERDSLNLIDRVVVEEGNPLLDTIGGKLHLMELFMQQRNVTIEQALTFLRTGVHEPMTEAAEAQLDLIRQENEKLLDGEMGFLHQALAIDNHPLHIREHAALLNSVESRMKPGFTDVVLAAIMQHMQAMQLTEVQMQSLVLGYDLPLPAMGSAAESQPGQEPMPGATPQDVDFAPEADYPQMPEPSRAGPVRGEF